MLRVITILCCTAILLPPPVARAQQQPSPQPVDFWHQDTLTGTWGGVRTRLQDSGITFSLQEQSEVWANLSGGLRRGVTYDGLTAANVQVDLGKLVGWSGATFFASGYQIHGRGPSGSLIGNLQTSSSLEATDSTKLFDLWLEQNLFAGQLSIRLGQEGASDELMLIDDAAIFTNGSFGFPALAATDLPSGGPNFPLATPFVRMKYHPNDAITLIGALFNGDPAPPGSGDPQRRDRNGTAFRLNDHALLFAEVWYSRNKGENASGLPGSYKLGVWFNTGRFSDVLYDTNHVPLASPASNGMPLQHEHDYAVYGIADQMIWRRPGTNDQGIALFLQVTGAPDDRNLSDLTVAAGMAWKAPFPHRDKDAFGLAVSYEGIGTAAQRYGAGLAYYGESPRRYDGNETVLEATYQYQVAPWWVLQPDAQYVINPGAGISPASAQTVLRNDFIIGLRTTITF